MTTAKPKLPLFDLLVVAGTLSFLCVAGITVVKAILRQRGTVIGSVVSSLALLLLVPAIVLFLPSVMSGG